MRIIAQVIVGAMLLTGIGFAKQPRYKTYRDSGPTTSRYYSYDNDSRWRDRSDSYRDYRYRNNYGYRDYSYRSLPPGIQKKLRRGGSLPPGQARRWNNQTWDRRDRGYNSYWR